MTSKKMIKFPRKHGSIEVNRIASEHRKFYDPKSKNYDCFLSQQRIREGLGTSRS